MSQAFINKVTVFRSTDGRLRDAVAYDIEGNALARLPLHSLNYSQAADDHGIVSLSLYASRLEFAPLGEKPA